MGDFYISSDGDVYIKRSQEEIEHWRVKDVKEFNKNVSKIVLLNNG
jgi:hypothetical protein